MQFECGVTILGAGAIGSAMAAGFRAAGVAVTLCDPDAAAREAAPQAVARHLAAILRAGLPAATDAGPLHLTVSATEAPPCDLVIEAGPERVEVKMEIFRSLLDSQPHATLATTSSAIPISEILPDGADQARCLVAHPGNPPSLIRVIELVPAPGTLPATMERASGLFAAAGFFPVPLKREIPAFVFNRLQSALLREAYRLVDEGVVGAADLDRLVRDGLGPRWALSGPFETVDLNTTGGIRGHAERMGPAYAAIGETRGESGCRWSAELVARVEAELRVRTPESALPDRRAWRESALADLLAARRGLLREESDGRAR